ncbi:hypothetical protein [Psychrobium sp. 1_MG-2023]|uniref:transporter substrate-binding domain-containing protein n=1 Tax=Psychrobium sp. 1_MG-2023 TaxID=3062624 RepID=UPI001291EDEF|nr:hypothetical protein [Psychrobium sp. 1_MG-2023]MDP2561920.1 hypothetical protein [Psychrobium sp. 1_MG-2023]
MTFKTGDKYPLMFEAPENSGVFFDVYTEAARRIGCKLIITRLPKQRIHEALKKGDLDFYPAASFSEKRAEYLHYIEVGITTKEYGLSSTKIPAIKNLSQLKEYPNLFWLMEANSSKSELAAALGIKTQQINYMNIEKFIKFVNQRPKYEYFYIADKEIFDTFLVNHKVTDLISHGLRTHTNCCGKAKPMFLGFSKRSKHYRAIANEAFNDKENVSATNQVSKLTTNSLVHRLAVALQNMKQEGVTEEIYNKWYPQPER